MEIGTAALETQLAAAKLAIAPYLIWIKIGAVLLVLGTAFYGGWKVCDWRWEGKQNRDIKALQDKMAKEQADWEAERQKWNEQSVIVANNLSSLETQKDTLLATLNGLKMTRTIRVEPNAQGECVAPVLDDSFRVRWNAVVATASAAASGDSKH